MKASSQARLLSSFKRFFRFALARNLRKTDPMVRIESPRRAARFPKTLSEDDVDALLQALDDEPVMTGWPGVTIVYGAMVTGSSTFDSVT